MSNTSEVSLIIAFTAGLLSFLSPCILPLFPSYITYITGRSFDDLKSTDVSFSIKKTTALHSLFFIMGFTFVFVLLGITLAYLGSFFGIRRSVLQKAGGALIILFGLYMTGVFKINLFNREKKAEYKKAKTSYFSSCLVGMAFATGWTPCVGPILSSILVYASTLDSLPKAVALLTVYSLGLGVPFFLGSMAVNHFIFMFNRFKAVMRFIPVFTGIFLILVGFMLLFGQFSRLAALISS